MKNQIVPKSSAFTLIELLVVISIIALLVGILLPALTTARRTARELACLTQVRSFTQAMFTYQADNGTLPTWARAIGNGSFFSIGGPVWPQTLGDGDYLGSDDTSDIFRCPIVFSAAADYLDLRGGDFAARDGFVMNYSMNGPVGGVNNRRDDPDVATGELFQAYSSDDIFEPSNTMLTAEKAVPFSISIGAERVNGAVRNWADIQIAHPQSTVGPGTENVRNLNVLILTESSGTNNMGKVDGSAAAEKGEMFIASGRIDMARDGSGWENEDLILDPFDPTQP